MSSHHPRSPGSRRRIAGERRPRAAGSPEPPEETGPPEVPQAPSRADVSEQPTSVEPAVAAPQHEEDRAERPAPSWLLVGLLGAAALVLVVLAAVLGLGVWDVGEVREAGQVDQAGREAPAAAERAATRVLSYDYRSLGADEKAAKRYLTPSYAKKYAKAYTQVRSNAGKIKARVTAEVKASGVSHADPHRVNVLVYVDQTTISTANRGEPQQALNRVMFSMQDVDGTWKVDDIKAY